MGLAPQVGMLVGPYAQDTHDLLGLVGQRVVDRLGESRMVVRRIVVDEQDLVVRIGHHIGEGSEADRRPLVEIVAVTVVATVQDDGKHDVLAEGYEPRRASSLRAAAYSIRADVPRSTTSPQCRRAAAGLPASARTPNWKRASVRRQGVSARASASSSVAWPAWSASSGAGHCAPPCAPTGTATGSRGAPVNRPAVRR